MKFTETFGTNFFVPPVNCNSNARPYLIGGMTSTFASAVYIEILPSNGISFIFLQLVMVTICKAKSQKMGQSSSLKNNNTLFVFKEKEYDRLIVYFSHYLWWYDQLRAITQMDHYFSHLFTPKFG